LSRVLHQQSGSAADGFALRWHSAVAKIASLEQEAEEKGGVGQLLADAFAKVYKVSIPLAA